MHGVSSRICLRRSNSRDLLDFRLRSARGLVMTALDLWMILVWLVVDRVLHEIGKAS